NILPLSNPNIQISTASLDICEGTNVSFLATSTQGKIYWKVNSNVIDSLKSNLQTSELKNSDVVSATLISSDLCPTQPSLNSNNLTFKVESLSIPTISVQNLSGKVCEGQNINVLATHNAGTVQWFSGNTLLGSGTSTSLQGLSDGMQVFARLNSSLRCKSTEFANSNTITIEMDELITPFVELYPDKEKICQDEDVFFNTESSSGLVQWFKNDVNLGLVGNAQTISNLNQNDKIKVTLTSDAVCKTANVVESNVSNIQVSPWIQPVLRISADKDSALANESFLLSTTEKSIGEIVWFVNGEEVSDGNSFEIFNWKNADTVWAVLNVESGMCYLSDLVESNKVILRETQRINSLSNLKSSKMLTLSPNPNNGEFVLSFEGLLQAANEIRICNSLGLTVYETSTQSNQNNLKLNLPSGTYFVSVQNNLGNNVIPFVISK
ncbi:MAG: T9SS type A sorting domain-containing protein, partial [Cytophagales bacterium]